MAKEKKQLRIILIVKGIFDIRSWIDYDRLHAFFKYVQNGLKKMFILQKNEDQTDKQETFKAAAHSLNLNDKDLLARQKILYFTSVMLSIMAFFLLIYAGYLLKIRTYHGALLCLTIVFIALCLAFRYHFWYFQIKSRKLGCTVNEWFYQGLLGKKK